MDGSDDPVLRDGIVEVGLNHGSLLDVGAGVGALTFELLDRGMTKAVVADASSAYISASKDEATRRGVTASTDIMQGDLSELGDTLPSGDLVTLGSSVVT